MTLNELETHATETAYGFAIQTIRDFWCDYCAHRFANNPHRQAEARLSDVADFRIWLYRNITTAVQNYLPASNSELRKIIKYCLAKHL